VNAGKRRRLLDIVVTNATFERIELHAALGMRPPRSDPNLGYRRR